MQRWEYCDVTWQPHQVIVTFCRLKDGPLTKAYEAQFWPQLLAKLGSDGWELTAGMSSPTGVQEYFFYFKRPLEDE